MVRAIEIVQINFWKKAEEEALTASGRNQEGFLVERIALAKE